MSLDMALRRGRVTASLLPSLIPGIYPDMPVFREKDALAAFCTITGRALDKGDNAEKKRAGHRVERFLLDWYAEDEGIDWAHFGSILHPQFEYFLATPDAVAVSREGAKQTLECKAVGLYLADQWGEPWQGADGVPPYVLVQAEAQAEVCDADECVVIGYFGGTDRRVFRWERDVTFGRYLLDVARRFYFDHVAPNAPPPPGPWTSIATVAALYPGVRRPMEPAPPDIIDDVEALLAIRDQRAALEALEAHHRARLAVAIGDREGFAGEGWRVRFGTRGEYVVPEHRVPAGRVLDLRRLKPKTDKKQTKGAATT